MAAGFRDFLRWGLGWLSGGTAAADPAYTVCLHGRDYRAATLTGAGGLSVTLAGKDHRTVTLAGKGQSSC